MHFRETSNSLVCFAIFGANNVLQKTEEVCMCVCARAGGRGVGPLSSDFGALWLAVNHVVLYADSLLRFVMRL
jgi:hypothetical protein